MGLDELTPDQRKWVEGQLTTDEQKFIQGQRKLAEDETKGGLLHSDNLLFAGFLFLWAINIFKDSLPHFLYLSDYILLWMSFFIAGFFMRQARLRTIKFVAILDKILEKNKHE